MSLLRISYFIIFVTFVIGEPKFRILAPEFVCPKDEDAGIDNQDNTIITLQTDAGSDLQIVWTVRWTPLVAPSQHFTVTLWRTVRLLEAKLNGPQPEPYVYIINDDELLHGVNYLFNVTAIDKEDNDESTKCFHIDNTLGDQKLAIEGRTDLLSLLLIGEQITYADMRYVLEAEVTTCYQTQDYYFSWEVYNTELNEKVNTSYIKGSRLEIPPYSLKTDLTYDVHCQVIKHSTNQFITQTTLHFQVIRRDLEVYLNVDYLTVPVNHPTTIESVIVDHNKFDDALTTRRLPLPVSLEWRCIYNEETCDFIEPGDNDTLYFASGFPYIGRYEVKLIVTTIYQSVEAIATITVVEANLPVIQIQPIVRMLNEGSIVSLTANATNVAPTCTLTWYFATEEYLLSNNYTINNTVEEYQNGEPLTETLTIYSLQENFLNELVDYTNETEWRQVTADKISGDGRARFLADCGCSLTFECQTLGTVYADVNFQLNEKPKAGDILVSPESGSALETVFRLSTLAIVAPNGPLTYSFYCKIGQNDSLLLGSIIGHLAIETFLPYVDGITQVWVEVCDIRGACSPSDSKGVQVSPGEGRTILTLTENVQAHIRRCELILLKRTAVSAIITYRNAFQMDLLSNFTSVIVQSFEELEEARCAALNYEQYFGILQWFDRFRMSNELNIDT